MHDDDADGARELESEAYFEIKPPAATLAMVKTGYR